MPFHVPDNSGGKICFLEDTAQQDRCTGWPGAPLLQIQLRLKIAYGSPPPGIAFFSSGTDCMMLRQTPALLGSVRSAESASAHREALVLRHHLVEIQTGPGARRAHWTGHPFKLVL